MLLAAVRAAEEGGMRRSLRTGKLVCAGRRGWRRATRFEIWCAIADRLRFVDSRGITTSCPTWVLDYLTTDPTVRARFTAAPDGDVKRGKIVPWVPRTS